MNKFTNSLINMRITKKLENALNSFNNKYAEFYGKYEKVREKLDKEF